MTEEKKLNLQEEFDKLTLAHEELQKQYSSSFHESQEQISKYAQLQSLIHNTSEGMIIFNPDSTVLSFNLAAQKILGYAEIDVMYRPINHLFTIPDEFNDQLIPFLRSTNNTDAAVIYIKHANGNEIPVSLSISEVNSSEMIFFDDETDDKTDSNQTDNPHDFDLFAISFQDLRPEIQQQQKILEQQNKIKQALAKAEESNKLKSEFIGNISHELRTPLNGILGLSEVLLNTELSKEQQQYAESIFVSGKGLLNIVNNILEFTKLGQKNKKQAETIQTIEVLQAIRDEFEPGVKEKELQLVIRKQKDVPEVLDFPDTGFLNMLRCLIDNAIKFTKEGEILIQFSMADAEQKKLVVAVTDTGIGIAEEQRNSIFNDFIQADGSIERSHGGLGIGLTIASNIANTLGANIEVDSEPGKGTSIVITIPLDAKQAPLVNPDLIENLHEQLGETFTELIDTFITDTQKHFEELKTNIEDDNKLQIKNILQYLQSSATNIGAERLNQNYRELLPQLDKQSQAQLLEQYQTLLDNFNETSSDLNKHIA